MRNDPTMDRIRLSSLLADRRLRMADLARALGVDKATVTRWGQKRVPAERVLDVERVAGIPRHDLRPDLYPREEAAP